MYADLQMHYKKHFRDSSGKKGDLLIHLLSNLQHLFIDGSMRELGMLVLFVKKANITEPARYFNPIFLPEGIQYCFPSLVWHVA